MVPEPEKELQVFLLLPEQGKDQEWIRSRQAVWSLERVLGQEQELQVFLLLPEQGKDLEWVRPRQAEWSLAQGLGQVGVVW